MPSNWTFIPALPWDNQHLSKAYIQMLYWMSEMNKQRLLYGNFEYDETPGRLFEYDKILSWFEKPTESELIEDEFEENPMLERMVKEKGKLPEFWYNFKMVVDPAREWNDLAMILVFNWLSVEEIVLYWKCSITELEDKCRSLMFKYRIDKKNVIVDEWWVWWGLKDALNCRWFIAHSSAIQPKKSTKGRDALEWVSYNRLRDQCYHLLSQKQDEVVISLKNVTIINSKLTIEQLKRRIIDDTDAIVQIDIDKDVPYRVMSKKDLKKKLGRSPDFWDCLVMYMLFFVKKPKRAFFRR